MEQEYTDYIKFFYKFYLRMNCLDIKFLYKNSLKRNIFVLFLL